MWASPAATRQVPGPLIAGFTATVAFALALAARAGGAQRKLVLRSLLPDDFGHHDFAVDAPGFAREGRRAALVRVCSQDRVQLVAPDTDADDVVVPPEATGRRRATLPRSSASSRPHTRTARSHSRQREQPPPHSPTANAEARRSPVAPSLPLRLNPRYRSRKPGRTVGSSHLGACGTVAVKGLRLRREPRADRRVGGRGGPVSPARSRSVAAARVERRRVGRRGPPRALLVRTGSPGPKPSSVMSPSRWPCVSMPSPTTVMPSAWAMAITAATISRSRDPLDLRDEAAVDLERIRVQLLQMHEVECQPVPKSSRARRTPRSERDWLLSASHLRSRTRRWKAWLRVTSVADYRRGEPRIPGKRSLSGTQHDSYVLRGIRATRGYLPGASDFRIWDPAAYAPRRLAIAVDAKRFGGERSSENLDSPSYRFHTATVTR